MLPRCYGLWHKREKYSTDKHPKINQIILHIGVKDIFHWTVQLAGVSGTSFLLVDHCQQSIEESEDSARSSYLTDEPQVDFYYDVFKYL